MRIIRNKIVCFFILSVFVHFNDVLVAQNVGIGTITPVEKLDVNGNIKVDTLKPNALLISPNAGIGKILTSDDAGNANWENLVLPPPTNTNGNIGYGVWGDCATNGNIADYIPMSDTTGIAGDYSGQSVSISGDFAIVGAPGDDESFSNQGSATIYHLVNNHWESMEKLTDPDGAFGDNFGISVSISGNFAIVGSYADDETLNGQGSAVIYQFDGSDWVWLQKLTDPDAGSGDGFGYSVSLSGDYAVVGSYADNIGMNSDQGSASIFQFNGTDWELMEKILDATGAASDNFGIRVAISGSYVIVGSYLDDAPASNQGSASIFQYNGTNWELMQKLTDSSGAMDDNFGHSVSISSAFAAIGAPGDKIDVNEDQGSVSVFRYNGSIWIPMKKTISDIGHASDAFGTSVSIAGNYMLVGAYLVDVEQKVNQGTVSLYQRLGNGWQLLQTIIEPGGSPSDFFGLSCALDISTRRFLIGASGYISNTGKAVFGKIN